MAADAGVTRAADRGRRLVNLLHHGADEAGKFGDFSGQDRFAEIDVAEHALQRIGMPVVGRGREKRAGRLRPIFGGRDRERFLAVEVMEEGDA